MKTAFRQQLERLLMRLDELEATLADPGIGADAKRYRAVTREHAEVAAVSDRFKRFKQRESDAAAARHLLADVQGDAEMEHLAREEIDVDLAVRIGDAHEPLARFSHAAGEQADLHAIGKPEVR
jgi:peptide chain release factor 1